MAFCMGSKSRTLMAAKKQQQQSKSKQTQLMGKPPQSMSPILQTEKQIKENYQRDQAAIEIMNQRKKKSFVIKSSIQQTRFTKKDIRDLKQRFEKHSTWILVDGRGTTIEMEGHRNQQESSSDYQQQLKILDQEKSNSNNQKAVTFAQSPNTSFIIEKPQTKIVPKGNYKKVEIALEESLVDHGIHYMRKMSKQQFRLCMGLLGLESNAFLSDRIFDVVDTDNDSYITFAQFATIMDTLINGEEDEKHEFSFSLLDVYDSGYFDFEEFREIITKIIAHWCIITGTQVKVEREGLKEIFDRMDSNKDGIVDIDEYKQALKGNPQLFQWFDLLNQGVSDGKKTQKDIVDIKVKALTDVIELQQKLNKVMNQMKTIELDPNNNNLDYMSSKQSSSQMSNFGSAFSKQKRDSFKIEDFDKSLQTTNYDNENPYGGNDNFLQSSNSSKNKKDNLSYLQLKYLLNPNSQNQYNSPQFDDLSGKLIQNNFTFSDLHGNSFNDSPQFIKSKRAYKKDSYQYQILEMKKQQEIQKQRKKEYGEKKVQISVIASKKAEEDSDDDFIDDPESPPSNLRINNRNKILNQLKQSDYHGRNLNLNFNQPATQHNTVSISNQGFISPLIKLQQTYLVNTTYASDIQEEKKTKRENSINSAQSQMRPEYQQSSQGYLNSQMSKHSRNIQQNQYLRQQSQHQQKQNKKKISLNFLSSDMSPVYTNDGSRSEMGNAQRGGPANNANIRKSSNEKPLSEINTTSRQRNKGGQKNKSHSFIEEIMDQNSEKYQLMQENENLKAQQQQIMNQLNDIQNLASHLLSQLQEDKDSAIGEQIKEYVENQKNKIMKNKEDDEMDEEEMQMHRISWNQDNGNLRPINEIRSFFKVRSRQRLHESIKKVNKIHKPLAKGKDKSFIHIGHDNWNLVLHMMLGIRQSVRNVMHEEVFELIDQDFKRKYCYELVAKKTKNMNLFEFYDFSPRVFHLIRNMYGITPDQYLKSIGPENLIGNLLMGNISSLKEQCSTGKSGSFFYYTADSNFMLKTISGAEFHNLRDILKDYYDHLAMYPHTLITRFFGLHKIRYLKAGGGKVRIYFVIMANVFKTNRDINVRFDLKGSTQGRKTRKNPDEYIDPSVALKDLDFLDDRIKIKVTPDIQRALTQQMQDDVRMFQKLNINDYSLLLGIHYLHDEEEARFILQNSPSIHQIIRNSFEIFSSKKEVGHLNVTYNSQKLLRPPLPFYEAHDGGIVSSDGKCVYFIGIIDTLTFFGTKKKLEYRLKSVAYGNKTISCIPPKNYGERFLKFMNNIFE